MLQSPPYPLLPPTPFARIRLLFLALAAGRRGAPAGVHSDPPGPRPDTVTGVLLALGLTAYWILGYPARQLLAGAGAAGGRGAAR